jgi:UDP-N-acetylmuramyl tripeptide synthase
VVTYSFENKKADVHTLKYQLSLFETEVLVQTPHGILEISSGLLGRDNIYNILATVAVGVAVGAPLEDIVKGIEEVDAIPGRCELIDEEQAFGVIIDHARTPEALSRLLDCVKELGPRRIVTGMTVSLIVLINTLLIVFILLICCTPLLYVLCSGWYYTLNLLLSCSM